jgi:hypothetical protein
MMGVKSFITLDRGTKLVDYVGWVRLSFHSKCGWSCLKTLYKGGKHASLATQLGINKSVKNFVAWVLVIWLLCNIVMLKNTSQTSYEYLMTSDHY